MYHGGGGEGLLHVPWRGRGGTAACTMEGEGRDCREDSKAVVLKFDQLLRENIAPSKIETFFEVSRHIIKTAQEFKYY